MADGRVKLTYRGVKGIKEECDGMINGCKGITHRCKG